MESKKFEWTMRHPVEPTTYRWLINPVRLPRTKNAALGVCVARAFAQNGFELLNDVIPVGRKHEFVAT